MSHPRIMLATLCLNEMEWLPSLYEQHKGWPGLVKWVFVEGADAVYASTNPSMVDQSGLSVDGTSRFLAELQDRDERVRYISAPGLGVHSRPDQGKIALRQIYLDAAEEVRPEFLIVVDGDEFWPSLSQVRLNEWMRVTSENDGWVVRHREIWVMPGRGPFAHEGIGGFFDTLYCRAWRWYPGLRYERDHNTPSTPYGQALDRRWRMLLGDPFFGYPEYVHMAFASKLRNRQAKHRYYEARGEGKEGGSLGARRQMYVDTRRAWELGVTSGLPGGAQIVPYQGPIPEVFSCQKLSVS